MKDIIFFIDKFSEQLTDNEVVEQDTVFKQLSSWDSLTSMVVINMIEDEYNVQITDDDLEKQSTINELFTLVLSKHE